jgi:hypothetical protein
MGCFYRLFISKYIGTAQTVDLAWAIPTHTKPHRPDFLIVEHLDTSCEAETGV